ncbi:hypothetical protein LXL04_035069 [Taraxacum kok-saghyz]
MATGTGMPGITIPIPIPETQSTSPYPPPYPAGNKNPAPSPSPLGNGDPRRMTTITLQYTLFSSSQFFSRLEANNCEMATVSSLTRSNGVRRTGGRNKSPFESPSPDSYINSSAKKGSNQGDSDSNFTGFTSSMHDSTSSATSSIDGYSNGKELRIQRKKPLEKSNSKKRWSSRLSKRNPPWAKIRSKNPKCLEKCLKECLIQVLCHHLLTWSNMNMRNEKLSCLFLIFLLNSMDFSSTSFTNWKIKGLPHRKKQIKCDLFCPHHFDFKGQPFFSIEDLRSYHFVAYNSQPPCSAR